MVGNICAVQRLMILLNPSTENDVSVSSSIASVVTHK